MNIERKILSNILINWLSDMEKCDACNEQVELFRNQEYYSIGKSINITLRINRIKD